LTTYFQFAISRDGARLVYARALSAIRVFTFDSSTLRVRRSWIRGRLLALFFSPDGQWLGLRDGKLKKISVAGGAPQTLCDQPAFCRSRLGIDGSIYFATQQGAGLWRVSASGGTPQLVTTPTKEW